MTVRREILQSRRESASQRLVAAAGMNNTRQYNTAACVLDSLQGLVDNTPPKRKWCADREGRKDDDPLQRCDEADRSTVAVYAARFGNTCRTSDA